MVDEGRLARLLRGIADRTTRLRAAAGIPDEDRPDLWLDGVKYLFVTTIEGCVDVAQVSAWLVAHREGGPGEA